MLVQAACYPNGTVSYSWNSDPSTWHLLVEYQCYNNGSTHEQTVSLHVLIGGGFRGGGGGGGKGGANAPPFGGT